MIVHHERRAAAAGRPTVLLLHGRGSHERDLLPLADALDPGLGFLAPRGPLAEGPGFAWFANVRIGIPVAADLDRRLAEVADWLRATAAQEGIALPLTAIGFSNGGMMAGALVARHPDLVDAAALLSSAYPLPEAVYSAGGLAGRPIFIGAGDGDSFHPLATLGAGRAAYAAAGADLAVFVYPGLGHGIAEQEVDDLRAWLTTRTGEGA